MKIVVVDGYTLNPGDLSWNSLKELGDCQIYERSTPEENVARCQNAEIAVTNKVIFDQATFDALPQLKFIAVTATGYNVIDTAAAKERGIAVSNVPVYGTTSVAQMVFALLLEMAQNVGLHNQTVHDGQWVNSDNFCYWEKPLIELQDLTMGIVGCGRIGLTTAKLAQAFGMRVIGFDSHTDHLAAAGIESVDLNTLLSTSDVVSLHCPLFPETEGMINKDSLSKMKSSAFLINTSRGPLINEADLAQALQEEQIAGAALDVLSSEPPKPDNPMLAAKNCIITPHISWATRSARARLMQTTTENIAAFIGGSPQNDVT